MKKSKTLVLGVNYKGVENYVKDYFKSIKNQDTNQFDLLILNDNASSLGIGEMNVNVDEIKISGNKSPAQIRYDGLNYAIKNDYQNLIFSDLDDFFSMNRISLSISALQKYDFVFNEIHLTDQKSKIIDKNYFNKICPGKSVDTFNQILDYNCLGLTHTGINLESIKNFYLPENIIAVDWWLFTILLLNGANGKYIDNAITYYRQTDENLVGMKKQLNENRLKTGIMVKQIHYSNIIKYCIQNNLEIALKSYALKKDGILELKLALKNLDFQKRYINIISSKLDDLYCGWWSEILDLKTWRTYAN